MNTRRCLGKSTVFGIFGYLGTLSYCSAITQFRLIILFVLLKKNVNGYVSNCLAV